MKDGRPGLNGQVAFFQTRAKFRRWLKTSHAKSAELWVGFYKVDSGRPSISWKEAVDEALCFGWIDGVRKSIDESSYRIRFTPRRRTSNWSMVNIRRYQELLAAGLVQPAGMLAYEATSSNSRNYSYEQEKRTLDEDLIRVFKKDAKAWNFFASQPPGYRRTASHWVISAKKEETRLRRLAELIELSKKGKRLGMK